MNHFDATHALRVLVTEKGDIHDHDALNALLDELTAAHQANGSLIAERDAAKRNVAELIASMRTVPQFQGVISDYAAVEAVKRIAADERRKLGE